MASSTAKIPTTFISYARKEAEFALKLAEDLRNAGANIWLDDHDITVGTDWTQAVEKALDACNQFLVILSPASVESKTVIAELNFALNQGKRVLPVLYRECTRPFRICAAQYADFTADYQTGFSALLKALAIEQIHPSGMPRSQLVEDVIDYLKSLASRTAELPKYYPAHLHCDSAEQTGFDQIRQTVQVVEDREELERWLAEEREWLRRAGFEVDRRAYKPRHARPELEPIARMDPEDQYDEDMEEEPPPTSIPWDEIPWDEHAGQRFHRAVILGDPGSGKTWLLRWEARRLAREAVRGLEEGQVRLEDLIFPILVRLSELNQTDGPVEEALLHLVGRYRSEGFQRFVREKSQTKTCIILLDAWDEVPDKEDPDDPRSRQNLGRRLEMFARAFSGPRLLMTSRIVGYGYSPIPGAQEVELLAFETPQIESFVRVWFGKDEPAAGKFLDTLQLAPQVQGLARIPLMLALLCRAFQENRLTFPTRRVELYRQCLQGLLLDWKRDEKQRRVSEVLTANTLSRLSRAALRLHADGKEQFSGGDLAEALGYDVRDDVQAVRAEKFIGPLKRDGILIVVGEHADAPMLFLHRTFDEYLASVALAEEVSQEGWRKIEALVDKKAWLPEWEQVVVLLAGQLKDPVPLIRRLGDRNKDDLFRHRLALAAMCLAEVPAKTMEMHAGLVNEVTAAVFEFFWVHAENSTLGAIPHFVSAWVAAGRLNGFVKGKPLVALVESYRYGAPPGRERVAAEALRLLRSGGLGAGKSQAVAALTAELRISGYSPSTGTSQYGGPSHWIPAANELARLGPIAASPEVVERLVQLLSFVQYWPVQATAARTLGCLGAAAAQPKVLAELTKVLQASNEHLQLRAAGALIRLGAPSPEVVARLRTLLLHQEPLIRFRAAQVLAGLGPPAISSLVARLMHELREPEAAFNAARALAQLSPTAVVPDVVARLAEGLHDRDIHVQAQAAEAFALLGPAAASPEVLAELERLVRLEEGYGPYSSSAEARRNSAEEALGRLRPRAAQVVDPEHVAALVRRLGGHSLARKRAAEELGRMGPAAVTNEVVSHLVEGLRDPRGNEPTYSPEAASGRPLSAAAAWLGRKMQDGFRFFGEFGPPARIEVKSVRDLAS